MKAESEENAFSFIFMPFLSSLFVSFSNVLISSPVGEAIEAAE